MSLTPVFACAYALDAPSSSEILRNFREWLTIPNPFIIGGHGWYFSSFRVGISYLNESVWKSP